MRMGPRTRQIYSEQNCRTPISLGQPQAPVDDVYTDVEDRNALCLVRGQASGGNAQLGWVLPFHCNGIALPCATLA